MKIGSIESKPVAPATATDRKAGADKSQGAISTAAEPSAQVELSSAATGLVSSDPTFDSAKVERISQAIRDGKFKINPEAIADKLIMNAEELLGRKLS